MILLLCFTPVLADTANNLQLQTRLFKCAEIADRTARLQCFDDSVAAIKKAPELSEQTKVERDNSWLKWFGLHKPITDVMDFGKSATNSPDSAVSNMRDKVVEWALSANGRLVLVLENGQVWKQIEGDAQKIHDLEDYPPQMIMIEEGAFGSFNLKIDDRRGFLKVRRVK